MHRFDSESDLESHELGRYLLAMLWDDDFGFPTLINHVPPVARPDPFEAVRERLAAVASAMRELHAQVNKEPPLYHVCGLHRKIKKKYIMACGDFWQDPNCHKLLSM